MNSKIFNVKSLKAAGGDSFLIRFGNENKISNILIDGGDRYKYVSKMLNSEIKRLRDAQETIDLLVLTHIDSDHIGGLINMFILGNFKPYDDGKPFIREIWFNSGTLLNFAKNSEIKLRDLSIPIPKSVKQDITFEGLINGSEVDWNGKWDKINDRNLILAGKEKEINGCKITVISPNKSTLLDIEQYWNSELRKIRPKSRGIPDYSYSVRQLLNNKFVEDVSPPNRTSIVLILEYSRKKILLLGDTIPSLVCNSLGDGKFDLVKVSHHGSKNNTEKEFLNKIDSQNFLISTNGNKAYNHPDKECLAKIAHNNKNEKKQNTTFLYNYSKVKNFSIFSKNEIEEYSIEEKSIENLEVDLLSI